jgi:hypothetical protein
MTQSEQWRSHQPYMRLMRLFYLTFSGLLLGVNEEFTEA